MSHGKRWTGLLRAGSHVRGGLRGLRPAGARSFVAGCVLLLVHSPALQAMSPGGGPDPVAGLRPFTVGEELTYRVSMGTLGRVGEAVMRVDGPEIIRGQEALLLRFDLRGRVAVFGIRDQTRSWIDPHRMATLRYSKDERHPLASEREEVEVYPSERRWVAAGGERGRTPSATPLDELSFLYHVRTLPLRDGDAYTCNLHFDAERNPVRTRVVARQRVSVPAGEFATVVVEMRVPDSRRADNEGIIRLYLTDDAYRVPVRIESAMPRVGTTVLSLESATGVGAKP